ncbi:MAG TPA: UDP-N-acetylmuramoyl-L-alanine--D-glutamate ligase, partial [Terriglobales bacterium]|nr:UDP-N-acetylmuramoyl-L-alanine--D-glutamate ligase [Terriglobales bacterium]
VTHGAKVTARDKNPDCPAKAELEALGVEMKCGPGYLDEIDADFIFKTPGMRFDLPELEAARARGAALTSEMEVFFDLCPCKLIAVTGSDGKSTTTTLISELLKAGGYTVHVGGNLGKPLLPEIETINPTDIAVLELSSFQLHTMKKSPQVAVVTNLSPNHLDVHRSMEEYVDAKRNIFRYQGADDLLVLNADNEVTRAFIPEAKGRVVTFGKSGDYHTDEMHNIYHGGKLLLKRSEVLLRGDHNIENYMAAIAAVRELVDDGAIHTVASTFKGLAHRLELVRTLDGVNYYNDSIASSPTRTMACLNAFEKKPIILAGGYDKKIPFDTLGEAFVRQAKAVILVGATADKIATAIDAAGGGIPVVRKENMAEAIEAAREIAAPGDDIVLSPACASFDLYKNFEERGNLFKNIVNNL